MERRSGNRSQYWFLGILFVFAAAYQIALTAGLVEWFSRGASRSLFPFSLSNGSNIIERPDYAAEAGLRAGDAIIDIEGRKFTGWTVLSRAFHSKRAGEVLTITVRDAASHANKSVGIRLRGADPMTLFKWASALVMFVLTPVLCLLLGFTVAAIRPRDPLAWLLLVLMLSFAQNCASDDVNGTLRLWPDVLRQSALFYHVFGGGLWPICLLLFGVYFPERLGLDRRAPWLKWLFLLPVAVYTLGDAAAAVGNSENFEVVAGLNSILARTGRAEFYLSVASVWCFFFAIWVKIFQASTRDARRRLLLLINGAGCSLMPLFLVIVWSNFLGHHVPDAITIVAYLFLALFPLTLAYVIVVHRALDVRVVIRQGLQYALAQRGIRIMQGLITLGVIAAAVSFASNPGQHAAQRLQVIGIGAVAIVFMDRGAGRLRGWTDRRFFREAYKAELILKELSDSVRMIVETLPLLQTVAQKIGASLHVPHVAVLLKDGSVYRSEYALGYAVKPEASLSEDGAVIARLKSGGEPLRLYFDDPESWIYSTGLPDAERATLRAFDAQLLLPLAYKTRLAGILVLGPKQSEEPYSASDLRLLESVATQTGLALENSRLTEAIATEMAHRERLNRELEIAREVQERLFPQTCPPISGVDYAGRCRPALGVGGDYYDWIELPGGGLGIAIGDVSGKGIPAALLMASLQACLRSQAIAAPADLANLMANMNRLTFDATPANRYATFFYGQYHPSSRTLDYVNAGHNPPMLVRSGELLRLDEGGPVIGLFGATHYTQARIAIEPGDILVLFTDGISEAMNSADEEWDEDRLLASIRACSGRAASQMIDDIVHDADSFVAGAPQHDDMTLIVVKFT